MDQWLLGFSSPQFESSRRQNLYWMLAGNWKDVNVVRFKKNSQSSPRSSLHNRRVVSFTVLQFFKQMKKVFQYFCCSLFCTFQLAAEIPPHQKREIKLCFQFGLFVFKNGALSNLCERIESNVVSKALHHQGYILSRNSLTGQLFKNGYQYDCAWASMNTLIMELFSRRRRLYRPRW